MSSRHAARGIALCAALVGMTLVAPVGVSAAPAAPASSGAPQASATSPRTTVFLRVEGATDTIFEARIGTRGHVVTTESGGTHNCDGTNNDVNPRPVPTATGALDDAARRVGFTWDGVFQEQFDDYFVTRIGESEQTDTQFWGILRNFEFTPVGGCQQRVFGGDQVLWAFDAFSKDHFLALHGPSVVRAGQPFTVRVTDGATGEPIAGASVGGATTGADGTARVIFPVGGVQQRLKAERADSIRSNALIVRVV